MAKMEVVRGMDKDRFTGRWYVLASIPSYLNPSDGVDTTVTYSMNGDGSMHVLNDTWRAGKRVSIEGDVHRARRSERDEAKLQLLYYFPPLFPIFPYIDPYWILYVDHNYQFAVVGDPSKKKLLILSRRHRVEEERYKEVVEKAKEKGYDVTKLRKTRHSDPPPPAGDPPKKKGYWLFQSLLFGK